MTHSIVCFLIKRFTLVPWMIRVSLVTWLKYSLLFFWRLRSYNFVYVKKFLITVDVHKYQSKIISRKDNPHTPQGISAAPEIINFSHLPSFSLRPTDLRNRFCLLRILDSSGSFGSLAALSWRRTHSGCHQSVDNSSSTLFSNFCEINTSHWCIHCIYIFLLSYTKPVPIF